MHSVCVELYVTGNCIKTLTHQSAFMAIYAAGCSKTVNYDTVSIEYYKCVCILVLVIWYAKHIVIYGLSVHTIYFHIINSTDFGKIKNIKCLLFEKFHILRRI